MRRLLLLPLFPLAMVTMGVGPCSPAPLGGDRGTGGHVDVGSGGAIAVGSGGAIATDGPGPSECDFPTSFTFGEDGGLRAGPPSRTYLMPPGGYRHTAWDGDPNANPPRELECETVLPPCRTPDVVDPDDVLRDLADQDVANALAAATPVFFGHDARPVDGTAFKLLRADGHGFVVGEPCRDGVDVDCRIPPPSVLRLRDDLRQLDREQGALPACAALNGR